jgi:hypothetical protein
MKFASFLPAVVALAATPALPVLAGGFDGSQTLVCAAIEVYSCEPGIKCAQETAETIDLPALLKISVQDKSLVGSRPSGEAVSAKIELVRHAEKKMFLQGVEKRFGWSMAIDEAKGKMALTIGDDDSGYVIFGTCMPQ